MRGDSESASNIRIFKNSLASELVFVHVWPALIEVLPEYLLGESTRQNLFMQTYVTHCLPLFKRYATQIFKDMLLFFEQPES